MVVTDQDQWDAHEAAIQRSLGELRRLALTRTSPGGSGQGDVMIDVVHGTQGVWQAWWLYADLHDTTEICAIVPDLRPFVDAMAGPATDDYAEVLALLQSRSLRFRLVLPTHASGDPVAAPVVEQLLSLGVQVRLAATSHWFFISRARTVVLPAVWGQVEDADVLVLRSNPVAQAFTELFDLRWAAAQTWAGGGQEWAPVLDLLAKGHDDDEVARRLGVSVRTVRRRVAEAMARFEVDTRFALGAAYGKVVRGDEP